MIVIGHYLQMINFRIEIYSMFAYLEGRIFCGNIYTYIQGGVGRSGAGERQAKQSKLPIIEGELSRVGNIFM